MTNIAFTENEQLSILAVKEEYLELKQTIPALRNGFVIVGGNFFYNSFFHLPVRVIDIFLYQCESNFSQSNIDMYRSWFRGGMKDSNDPFVEISHAPSDQYSGAHVDSITDTSIYRCLHFVNKNYFINLILTSANNREEVKDTFCRYQHQKATMCEGVLYIDRQTFDAASCKYLIDTKPGLYGAGSDFLYRKYIETGWCYRKPK